MTLRAVLPLVTSALAVCASAQPQSSSRGSRQPVQASHCTEVPAHAFDLVLARPTIDAVTLSVLAYQSGEGLIAYGTEAGRLTNATPRRAFIAGEPAEIVVAGLRPDTTYHYRLKIGETNSPEGFFHTARPPGKSFTFTVTADSHLDEQTDPAIYQRTLANALGCSPDFHIDLGDTFMTEKHATREAALKQYLAQRYYLGQLGQSTPLFLVLGNHDGESPRGRETGSESLPAWSCAMRKRYFPNPVPNDFYSGNVTRHPAAGFLEDYYAWEWGDALFVVLDPFWFSSRPRGQSDNWAMSLGEAQYRWLAETLARSRAAFKCVFIHHLVGGKDNQCRGGVEVAPQYEWGGQNADGSVGFGAHRPGWTAPIHELLVKNRVRIVFHGHDHLYARQELDGIIYQEVPQPGYPGDGRPPRSAAEYGYAQGTILGSSGCLAVRVTPERMTVDYLLSPRNSRPPGADSDSTRRVLDSYTLER